MIDVDLYGVRLILWERLVCAHPFCHVVSFQYAVVVDHFVDSLWRRLSLTELIFLVEVYLD